MRKGWDGENIVTLSNEAFINSWETYRKESKEIGVFEVLKKYFVGFQFPIQQGISQTMTYKMAYSTGKDVTSMKDATGLVLIKPESLKLFLYDSIAGLIPVLVVPDEKDFQSIIQAFVFKNEPKSIPSSMGAAIIKGLINWNRIKQLQKQWVSHHPLGNWNTFFKNSVIPNKTLYQDKLIVLSKKNYSGVAAATLGLEREEWLEYSLNIRLEHECAHYFTYRYLGTMRNNMHDELIADYMGITKVLGHFKSDWFLAFIGLEGSMFKKGGRMKNYLGKPELSTKAFDVLKYIMIAASENVSSFNHSLNVNKVETNSTLQLLTLCSTSLEEMAVENGVDRLLDNHYCISNN